MDQIIAQSAIFRGLDAETVSALIRHLDVVDVNADQAVFTEGDLGDWMYIIMSGKVKIGRRARDGRENLFAILGPSDMFGELCTFDPGSRTATATALTDVRAAVLQRDVLLSWIAQRPELADRLLRILARRLRRTNHDLSDLVFTDVAGRVARQLLRLAQQFGVQDHDVLRVTHDLTQEELAQLVGSSRETVNKALGDFSARGWISLHGKSVLIADSERLAARARETMFVSALTDAEVISQAEGMIMERFGIDDAQAFTLLRKLSQGSNTSVSGIAADIINGGPASRILEPPSHF